MNTDNSKMDMYLQRHIRLDISKESDYEKIERISKALSVKIRSQILLLIKANSLSIVEIANRLNIPVSSTAFHIKTLENAGLVITETQPGIRGSMRVCIACTEDIYIDCSKRLPIEDSKFTTIEMPIGNYFDFDITPPCGMADENGLISGYDNPVLFCSPVRIEAQLIWFAEGYLQYRFPIGSLEHSKYTKLAFSMEICSEALGYREIWPSDITVAINNVEILTYTSPGDFGNRRGKITSCNWPLGSTQYGLLKNFTVDRNGAYIDGILANKSVNIDMLSIHKSFYISLKIMVKNDAKHIGGINIFGNKFGDFPQGIFMNLYY